MSVNCKYCHEDAAFTCSKCGKGLCWNHARLQVVCTDCLPKRKKIKVLVRAGNAEDKSFLEGFKKTLLLSDSDIHSLMANHVFIAEIDNVSAGFVVLKQTSETEGWLCVIGVLPSYQRMGIGTELMDTLINAAKNIGLKQINLTTSNEAVPALMLYMKHGFKIVDVKIDAYKKHGISGFGVPGFDELHLQLKL